jgi:hypothetical protein
MDADFYDEAHALRALSGGGSVAVEELQRLIDEGLAEPHDPAVSDAPRLTERGRIAARRAWGGPAKERVGQARQAWLALPEWLRSTLAVAVEWPALDGSTDGESRPRDWIDRCVKNALTVPPPVEFHDGCGVYLGRYVDALAGQRGDAVGEVVQPLRLKVWHCWTAEELGNQVEVDYALCAFGDAFLALLMADAVPTRVPWLHYWRSPELHLLSMALAPKLAELCNVFPRPSRCELAARVMVCGPRGDVYVDDGRDWRAIRDDLSVGKAGRSVASTILAARHRVVVFADLRASLQHAIAQLRAWAAELPRLEAPLTIPAVSVPPDVPDSLHRGAAIPEELSARLASLLGAIESTGARRPDQAPATKLPRLKTWAMEAWRARQAGATVSMIATTLAAKYKDRRITQPRVSEQIKLAKMHTEASGLAEVARRALPQAGGGAPARTLDPAVAELGQRTDGRAKHVRDRAHQIAKEE